MSAEINQYYLLYLGRPAEPTGLAGWVNYVSHGGRIEDVLNLIFGSIKYFQKHGNTPSGYVQALYQDVLGRAPGTISSSEVDGWVAHLNSGLTRSQLAAILTSSPEYRTHIINQDYQTLLGRPVEQSALVGWLNFLNNRGSVEEILAVLLSSGEFWQDHAS